MRSVDGDEVLRSRSPSRARDRSHQVQPFAALAGDVVDVFIPRQTLIEDNSEKSSRFLCLNRPSVDMQLDIRSLCGLREQNNDGLLG